MIRLLADENVPLEMVDLIREAGHEVQSIAEDARSALDVDVLRIARESERVLVTFDRDFGELVYRDLAPVPPGVIYLRFPRSSPAEIAAVLLSFLTNPDAVITGRFTVLTTDTVRQRALSR